MKNLLQKTQLRVLVLVTLLCAGLNSAWGETVKYVFTAANWNATINGEAANWTSGKAGSGFSNNGIQVTTTTTGANGTSPIAFENISKIVLTYNTNKSKGKGTIDAKIGDNEKTTKNVEYTGSVDGTSAKFTTEFTYSTPQTGNVTLTVNTTTNSIYLVSAEITYSPSTPDTRTTVNMTSFTANKTTLIKGQSTTTSVTNDQTDWTSSYIFTSDAESVATVDENGIISAVGKGIANITAALDIASTDEDYKVGETASMTLKITVNNPSHTATFSINGTTSTDEFEEGTAISFPPNPSDIEGKTFVGWTTEAVTSATDEVPTLVNNTIMGSADVTYYAVFATQEVEASTTTATLTETEIQTNFTASSHKYTDGEVLYNDTEDGINWAASYIVDYAKRPWIQIKKDATAYLKINTANNISEIKLTITSAQNSSGGIADITKHTAYSGTVYLESTVSDTPAGALGSSNVITNNVLTLIPTSNVKDLYIQVSTGARIWGAEVTYGTPASYSGYCTTVTAEQPVVEPGSPVEIAEGYYSIKNNGNSKYVRVAGRKTVVFDDNTNDAGTVIRVKANGDGQVEILRSQGIDVPSYAEKAMTYYVPKIVELAVDKLHANGEGNLLGANGLDAIMAKFKEGFDYHLYLEEADGGYRIYGRTPSMKPVVDFYAENKDNVDAKLPGLETFINSAINKVLEKTGGRGASILVPFSLQTVWQKMGGTLTEPVDEVSTMKFYEEVLSSETNVWNFAFQTAMIYWGNVKTHPRFEQIKEQLGDYANYIDKVENIQPNFKYYIVQKDNKVDFISQGNSELNAAFTSWKLTPRTDFNVTFDEENILNGKYYTTLYTDFAYTLPEGVKAYKVTKVSKIGVAVKEELETVPAQTPVLLESESADVQTLTLSTEDGTAPTDNLLRGADFLINEYTIKTAQVETLFDFAKEILGDNAYNSYVKEYEHLMLRNSGTVNNKYFFGLDQTDLKNAKNVRMLNLNDAGEKLGFYSNWTDLEANRAFIVDTNDPVKLFIKGDVNRDGEVNVTDVIATVDIILHKLTPEEAPEYDFIAADAIEDGSIDVIDVPEIVNISLGKY